VALDVVSRLVVGGPYPGATALLLLACGVSLVPFLPSQVARFAARVAVVPALGLVSFAVLLTTLSVLGIELTEVSIRLGVAALVGGLGLAHRAGTRSQPADGRDALALTTLGCIVLFALAAAWDVVGPFPPPAVDWGHYLLYADEVAAEGELLLEDRYAGEDGRLYADSPGVGALYGGTLILDGVDSSRLSSGVVLISALSPLTVFATGASLWGLGAGLVAAGLYAASPIHMDPIRWHGVGTTLALVFVPLLVLALGLMFRGERGWAVSALLAAALLGVAVTHSTSTFVVIFVLGIALVVDVVRHVLVNRPRALRAWWERGITRPLLVGLLLAGLVGGAVVAHLHSQAADLGSPVSYRLFEPDWLTWRVVEDYYSAVFLGLTVLAITLVVSSRSLRRDAALLAVLSLGAACVVVAQLWRLEIPFEYRRVVQYLGIAMAILLGVASVRLRRDPWTVAAYVVMFAYLAHHSVGLRLPQRILTEREAKGNVAQRLIDLRSRIEQGELPDAHLIAADKCLNFIVPYLLRRPTIVAFEPWQVGFESRLPSAARAQAVLDGGPRGRRLAAELGVGYVVANPVCTPGLAERLNGTVVAHEAGIVVVLLPREPERPEA
jgi:hypothetical protein